MRPFRRLNVLLSTLAVLLCILTALLVRTASPAGKELADLLESEATANAAAPPPYALYRAFDAATAQHVARAALPDDGVHRVPIGGVSLDRRDDGLMDRRRTVVSGGTDRSVDVCFRLLRRFFFRSRSSNGTAASSLQLWPYFYHYEEVLDSLASQTVAQTQHGVLDIDAAAYSVLYDVRNAHEMELVLLAYNDWDANADEALAALANFTRVHHGALYGPDGLDQITAPRARNCGGANVPTAAAVAAIRRDAFDTLTAAATPAPPQPSISSTAALYATLNLQRGGVSHRDSGVLQLVGAARMAAFDERTSAAASAFVNLQRSASPRLFFITSDNIGAIGSDAAAATVSPPSLLAERGVTARDVHRFVHQHSRSSLLLRNKAAYLTALQLHQRIVVLVGDPNALPSSWWATLSAPPSPTAANAGLRALRRKTPFFLLESAGPVPAVTPTLSGGHRRCVLPTRRLELGAAVRAVHGDDVVNALLQTLVWRSTALQLRVVQQRPSHSGDAEADCVWVQVIEVPSPTAATDVLLYDAIVMSAAAELAEEMQRGGEDWVVRLRSTADFARQLDHLLKPPITHANGRPPPALLIAVETANDCTAALQALRRGEQAASARNSSAAATAMYATLSSRLTTVEAELRYAAAAVPISDLPLLLSTPTLRLPQWRTFAARCPLFAVLRESEDIYHFRTAGSDADGAAAVAGVTPSAPSAALEGIADDALAAALIEVYAKLPASPIPADAATVAPLERAEEVNDAQVAVEVRSDTHTTAQRGLQWCVVLPPAVEAPLIAYSLPAAAQGVLSATLPSSAATFVLLVLKECGVCANYWKAFELLRLSYHRTTQNGEARRGDAGFVLVDLALGFTASRAAAMGAAEDDVETGAHWQRAQETLLPSYLANVKALTVPQLLLMNGTHVLATVGTEAYAERWHWPHALLRLMALIDPAVDVEATKSAMWSVLSADRAQREHLRSPPS